MNKYAAGIEALDLAQLNAQILLEIDVELFVEERRCFQFGINVDVFLLSDFDVFGKQGDSVITVEGLVSVREFLNQSKGAQLVVSKVVDPPIFPFFAVVLQSSLEKQ